MAHLSPAKPIHFDVVRLSLNAGVCPDCGGKHFFNGPEGGLTVNIKCAGCGHEFSYCPPCFAAPRGFAERIGEGAESNNHKTEESQ